MIFSLTYCMQDMSTLHSTLVKMWYKSFKLYLKYATLPNDNRVASSYCVRVCLLLKKCFLRRFVYYFAIYKLFFFLLFLTAKPSVIQLHFTPTHILSHMNLLSPIVFARF